MTVFPKILSQKRVLHDSYIILDDYCNHGNNNSDICINSKNNEKISLFRLFTDVYDDILQC